jgi:hypothetical protein
MTFRGNEYRVKIGNKLFKVIGGIALGLVLISLYMSASTNYESDGIRRKGMNRTIEGVRQMDRFHKYQALGVAGFLTLVAVFALIGSQKDKQIVIGLDFNEENRDLTIKSQTIFSKQIIEETIHHPHIRLADEECLDLLGGKIYAAIKITNDNKNHSYAYLLKGHYTWSNEDILKIKEKVRELGYNYAQRI